MHVQNTHNSNAMYLLKKQAKNACPNHSAVCMLAHESVVEICPTRYILIQCYAYVHYTQ